MTIAYIFASRSRPEKFFKTLENIQDMSESKDYFVWAKLDEEDESMNNDVVKEKLKEFPEVTVKWGLSKGKIDAINRSCEDLPPCDILIIMSDDIRWDVWGFDGEIRESFTKYFPKLDGTIHWPEYNAKDRTIIVSILGANLYKKLGYLYYQEYISVYSDNDFTEMTRAMNKYVFIDKILFSHHHPIFNRSEWDSQYRKTESPEFYTKDRETFTRRKAANFGI